MFSESCIYKMAQMMTQYFYIKHNHPDTNITNNQNMNQDKFQLVF